MSTNSVMDEEFSEILPAISVIRALKLAEPSISSAVTISIEPLSKSPEFTYALPTTLAPLSVKDSISMRSPITTAVPSSESTSNLTLIDGVTSAVELSPTTPVSLAATRLTSGAEVANASVAAA